MDCTFDNHGLHIVFGVEGFLGLNKSDPKKTKNTISVRPSVRPSVSQSVRPSIFLSVCLSVRPSLRSMIGHILYHHNNN